MSDRDDFLAWVKTTLYEAELALHNGDAAPRRAIWSRNEPVSVLSAWRNAHGQHELDPASHAPTPCGPRRGTAAKAASGR